MGADAHPQGYVCPMCGRRYTPLEAISSQSPDGMNFVCDDCGNNLIEDDTSEESKANQERQRRLMDQLNPIINSLIRIDELVIPENTFESSLAIALPPATSRGPSSKSLDSSLPTARADASGRQGGGAVSLQVNITSSAETAKLEKKQEEEKARLAAENALPAWHLQSTVGKSMYNGEGDTQPGNNANNNNNNNGSLLSGNPGGGGSSLSMDAVDAKPAIKDEEDGSTRVVADETEASVDAFFAQLNSKREEDDDEDDDDDDEDDDDEDDDEFEDVVTTTAPVTAVEDLDDDSDSD